MEAEAVCSEQAEESEVSFRSENVDRGNTASWGVNLSRIEWKCTETRAI